MEITENQLYYNFIFGAFAGWWAGSQEDRTQSPLLSIDQWSDKLQATGFEQTEPFFCDYKITKGGTINVFVAHAKDEAPANLPLTVDVYPAPATFVKQLEANLRSRKVDVCDLSDPLNGDRVSVLLPEVCACMAWGVEDPLFEHFRRRILESKAVIFVARTAAHEGEKPDTEWVSGWCRSLRLEHDNIRQVTLELSSELDNSAVVVAAILRSRSQDLSLPNAEVEQEFLEREGQLFISRVSP
ncbi:MAG: hypothetical protein Q9227_007315 [Pyrenula ochraceoflavens]